MRMPSFVQQVTGNDVISFLESKPDLPKAILITSKRDTPPLWKGLSADFYGRMVFGEGKESDQALITRFAIDQFPRLFVFPVTAQSTTTDDPVIYEGDMKHAPILSFLERHAEKSGRRVPRRQEDSTPPPASSKSSKESSEAPVQITNQQEFEKLCLSRHSGLCGIFFVDPNMDTPIRRTMRQITKQFADRNIQFVWLDGNTHARILDELGEGVSKELPSLVVVHPHKRTYTGYHGEFTEKALMEGIDNILLGDGHRVRYSDFPRLAS
jgi:hypothetical protein